MLTQVANLDVQQFAATVPMMQRYADSQMPEPIASHLKMVVRPHPVARTAMARSINPYGDGRAAERIARFLAGQT